MNNEMRYTMTRRGFFASACMVSLLIPYPELISANSIKEESADGYLHLKCDGKIYINSGGGYSGLYDDQTIADPIIQILQCERNQYAIEVGNNPAHLWGLLMQCSNHLSFSSYQTNKRAAFALKAQLLKNAALKYGGLVDDYHVAGGKVYSKTGIIGFKELAFGDKVITDDVSQKTRNLIDKASEDGLIIAVGEVV